MSVDCKIELPALAGIDDVCTVMGILAGLPFVREELTTPQKTGTFAGYDTDPYWFVKVPGATINTKYSPNGTAQIHLEGPMVDGEEMHHVLYFYEHVSRERTSMRMIMPKSTAFWIAIGKGLVNFFGGVIDYNDCDESYVDYAVEEQYIFCDGDPNEKWQEWQERIASVTPLTMADLIETNKHASYGMAVTS